MKSEEEIRAKLKIIEDDSRYQSGLKHPALIAINAPLALIQVELAAKHSILKWMLE